MAIGFDFGTTNSSIALAAENGDVQVASFADRAGSTESFRSLLYLERIREARRSIIKSWAGPEGIAHYLQGEEKGRLIQSLKSFLASRSLQSTEIFGRRFQLEDLVANVVRDIRTKAEQQFGLTIRNAVVGRPVHFVGAESQAGDDYAVQRLTRALNSAGFETVEFEFEPVAAAYYYESRLDHDELILIGDFGGGTSDFSLLHVGPSVRRRGGTRAVLGNGGLALAGDSFDAKIIRHLVSPALGAGTLLDSAGKLLPVPTWVYFKLERWHHLSFLRSAETLNMLQSVAGQALEAQKLNALLYLIKHDLGYHLHRAVQLTKVELSHSEHSRFEFIDGDLDLHADVSRSAFESWISEELLAIEQRVDSLLSESGVCPADVDRVFLTGGSSFVPAVRRIFETRFGAQKIRTGDEFTSVARGLALRALDFQ
jgi:hypothetical chaperone protein